MPLAVRWLRVQRWEDRVLVVQRVLRRALRGVMAVSVRPRLLATVRARALQRQLAVRKLLVVMEVEEKRAVAAMLLLVRAPMRVRSLGMEVRTVQLVIQPRETKVEMPQRTAPLMC